MPLPFHCPCCGYPGLTAPPYQNLPAPPWGDLGEPPYIARFGAASFEGCDCCGYEFGFDCDAAACGTPRSFQAYRAAWLQTGAPWFSSCRPKPAHWNLARQLVAAGLAASGLM
jgi:hypothetical protein